MATTLSVKATMTQTPDDLLPLESDPAWYKDAIFYELHVRAFSDSNADGIGDFPGLTQKLDYLQDLGVNVIWLLPFYPSPLRDDGYDIAHYTDVNPAYGRLEDFKAFLDEAHRRGLRVVTELVLNHTSDQHPWFQRARRAAPGTPERDFYVWSDTPDRYRDARIIFKDFEQSNWSWDPVANAYYWHRFYHHQPDLNFDNPAVHEALFKALDFWLEMGVDGMRLDAVPYLYEREGTNCENLPETLAFLKKLRAHVDARFQNRMLLAEANQWPEDAVQYFGNDDACHMAFHFPLMPRMFMAVKMEDRFPLIDILGQTPAIPPHSQWALFLRNHDELTLEMVTDEERDYMYRVYATDPQARINLGIRRRLAPLLGHDRLQIDLMNALLLSMPGTPVIYYGDEIWMGDNIYLGDRNGVRTPMQWSGDRNAGFSRAPAQRLYLPPIIEPEYHYEAVNVEARQSNPNSPLWWMKRTIALRRRYRAFGRGTLEFLYPENRKILAFVRRHGDETLLIVANLSRSVQYAELDLRAFQGSVPVELFGLTELPAVGKKPYVLTLGPYGFYWFALTQPQRAASAGKPTHVGLSVTGSWESVFRERMRPALCDLLPAWLKQRRWFGAKARKIRQATLRETVPLYEGGFTAHLVFLELEYSEGSPETYAFPLAFASSDKAKQIEREYPQAVVARVDVKNPDDGSIVQGILYDAAYDEAFARLLLDAIAHQRRFRAGSGELVGVPTSAFQDLLGSEPLPRPAPMKGEQSNTSVAFGDRFVLKLVRRPDEGVNPELEMGRYLTERVGFPHVPKVAGAFEYHQGRGEPMTLAILQQFVPNEGDAWSYTLDQLRPFYERAMTKPAAEKDPPRVTESLAALALEAPMAGEDLVGTYVASARLLGTRTGELHTALASFVDDPAFAPEPYSTLYQRSLYQSMRTHTSETLSILKRRLSSLPEALQDKGRRLLDLEDEILRRFRTIAERKIAAARIRVHGDYHLGQVLYTGRDFVIIDFEGEPSRPVTARRIKRAPLRDVAGMLRSFHYAAFTVLLAPGGGGFVRPEDIPVLEPWARFWTTTVSAAFLRSYLQTDARHLLPTTAADLQILLDVHLLEKALYELGYELNNRPEWIAVPLTGLLELMEPRS
jgi:maltose alpha-D-glucosyltransferase / alpha-amylase